MTPQPDKKEDMNPLSQLILKKREEFDEKFEDVEDAILCNHSERHVENDDCKKLFGNLKSFLTQSHIELLEEMKRKLQSWLMNYDSKDGYSNLHDEILENLLDRLSKTINEVKK